MRHVFPTMGTVASVELDDHVGAGVLDELHAIFGRWEREFSLYDERSPLSALARGELMLEESDASVRAVYAEALQWRDATGGAFTPHRPDGVIDLSGLVKARAIEDAGRALLDAGALSWSLNVGGDVLVSGASAGEPWMIGIVDPDDRDRLLANHRLLGSRRAVATSGSAERGDHIWTKFGSTDVRQSTVVADDIVTADVLATSIVAAGTVWLDELTARFDVDALVVTRDGLLATPGLLVR